MKFEKFNYKTIYAALLLINFTIPDVLCVNLQYKEDKIYYSCSVNMRHRAIGRSNYLRVSNFTYENRNVVFLLKNGILVATNSSNATDIAEESALEESDFMYTKVNCCADKPECIHLKIPYGVKEIARNTFCNMCIDHVEIPDTVEIIGRYAFCDTPLRGEIEIPSSVISLGKGCFGCCELIENIKFNEGLQLVGELCFANCLELKQLMLPDSVQYIGDSVCYKCNKLLEFKFPNDLRYIGENIFTTDYIRSSIPFNTGQILILPENCLCKFHTYICMEFHIYVTEFIFDNYKLNLVGDCLLGTTLKKGDKQICINTNLFESDTPR